MWDTLSPNCRLAMAQYQCFSTYTPCPNLVLPSIYPLLAPHSLCASISTACSSASDQIGVSLTLSSSTNQSNPVSPLCATPGSADDSLAQSLATFTNIASVPVTLYGRCETYGMNESIQLCIFTGNKYPILSRFKFVRKYLDFI